MNMYINKIYCYFFIGKGRKNLIKTFEQKKNKGFNYTRFTREMDAAMNKYLGSIIRYRYEQKTCTKNCKGSRRLKFRQKCGRK